MPVIIIFSVAAFLIALILLLPIMKKRRRHRIKKQPFKKEWREILRKNLPYFYKMPADLQLQLKQHIAVFIAEKKFYGFEGIEINDEIKVTVAAQACLLLLNRDTDYFPGLKSIYIYPAAFITQHQQTDAAGVLQQNRSVLSGESWQLGKVVLSWRDTQQGGRDAEDGHNVVIHEFAHQLDQETGMANGAPLLKKSKNKDWPAIFSAEFEKLRVNTQHHQPTLLDKYGATNPAEFFAVASEVFFEQAQLMQQQHPALYQQLSNYYSVDPAVW